MALSKPLGQPVVEDIPVIAQHYLVCGTEDCKKIASFTAIPVIYRYVNNVEVNIGRIWKLKTMK